jgi:uncharacterized coiled-coil DUF342 family protein
VKEERDAALAKAEEARNATEELQVEFNEIEYKRDSAVAEAGQVAKELALVKRDRDTIRSDRDERGVRLNEAELKIGELHTELADVKKQRNKARVDKEDSRAGTRQARTSRSFGRRRLYHHATGKSEEGIGQ